MVCAVRSLDEQRRRAENKLLTKQAVPQTLVRVELGSGGFHFSVIGDVSEDKRRWQLA